jgi:ferredoxin
MADTMMAHASSTQECIEQCTQCHNACLALAARLLREDTGRHTRTVALLLDCAQICRTSADFMLRRSPLQHLACGVCVDVCEECALACEALGTPEAGHCADLCRRCAVSCREMFVASTAGAARD